MTKKELIAKLNRKDISGIGIIAYYPDGNKLYYFYEDFGNDIGIFRAERHFQNQIGKGYISKVEYIYKDDCIHFWDWDEKSGLFCAQDEYIQYNKCFGIEWNIDHYQRFISIINGQKYKYDYTAAIDGISGIKAIEVFD